MIEVVSTQAAKNNLNFYLNSNFSSDYKNLKLKTSPGFLVFYNDCLDGIASSSIFNARGARIFNCSTDNVVFHPVNPALPINYPELAEKIQGKLKTKNLHLIFLDFSVSQHKELAVLNLVPFIIVDHNSCSFGAPCYIQVINTNYDSCTHLLADIFPMAHTDENQVNTKNMINAVSMIEGCGLSLIGNVSNKEILDEIYGALTSYPGSFAMYDVSKKISSSQTLKAMYNYVIDEVSPENEAVSKDLIEFNKKAWQYEPKIEYEYNIANGIKIGAIVYDDDKFDAVYKRIAMLKAASLPHDILLFVTEVQKKRIYDVTIMSKIPCNVGLFCENNKGACQTNRIGNFTVGTTSIIKKLNVLVEDLKSYINITS
jgi:hypothetical protein